MKKLVILIIVIMSTLFGCTHQDTVSNQSSIQNQSNIQKEQLNFPIAPESVADFNRNQKVYESDKYFFICETDAINFSMIDKVTSQVFKLDKKTSSFYYSGDYIIYLCESGYKVITFNKNQNCFKILLNIDKSVFSSPVIVGKSIYWIMIDHQTSPNWKLISTDLNGNNLKEITTNSDEYINELLVYKQYIVYEGRSGIFRYNTQTKELKNIFSYDTQRKKEMVYYSENHIVIQDQERNNNILVSCKYSVVNIFDESIREANIMIESLKTEDTKNKYLYPTIHYYNDKDLLYFACSTMGDVLDTIPVNRYVYNITDKTQKYVDKKIFLTSDTLYIALGISKEYNYYLKNDSEQINKLPDTYFIVKEDRVSNKMNELAYHIDAYK